MSNCETVAVTFDVEDIAVEVVCVEPQIEVRVTMSPTWADVSDKPAAFAPSAHAASHAAGGSDPVTLSVGQVSGLQAALDSKATPADVTAAVSGLVNSAPAALDTLNELAAALGNDANFASTVTTALAAKAPLASPTFTGTVSGVTKGMVGLGNVDNTADASKPVSTAQAAADAAVASAAAADATSKAAAAQAAAVQRANHTGTQAIATVDGLQAALDGKAGTTDSRLTDARTPTAHKASHATGGTDALTPADIGAVATNDSRLTDQRVPTDGSVTDAKITAAGLSTSSLNWAAIQPWAANTAYQKGDLVSFQGIAYRRAAAGTSGATFNTANWQQITPTDFVASQIASGTIATARLGSGTASASTFLRGDQTYAAPVTSLNSATGAVTMPTMVEFTPTASTATGATKTDFTGYAVWNYTIPSAAQYAIVELQGAGAGGGSGRRGAAGSNRGGGGGGGAGPFRRVVWRLADLASRNIDIQLATGGAGGASVTADDTNGNPGSQPGAASNIQLTISPFHVLLRASSTVNGAGGTTAGGAGGIGAQLSASDPFGGSPGGAGGVGAAGTAGTAAQCEASSGGGGGGGLDTANTTRAGGAGGASVWIGASAGGAAGTAGGGNGAAGATFGASICSTGGGGGGSATAAAGGNGGNGGRGAGGGGGGASTNGFASGAGGNGGDAFCRIILF